MKVKTQDSSEERFKPFELVITLDTPEEAGAIYALFNHANITDITQKEGIDNYAIREELSRTNAAIQYKKVHEELCGIIR